MLYNMDFNLSCPGRARTWSWWNLWAFSTQDILWFYDLKGCVFFISVTHAVDRINYIKSEINLYFPFSFLLDSMGSPWPSYLIPCQLFFKEIFTYLYVGFVLTFASEYFPQVNFSLKTLSNFRSLLSGFKYGRK